MPHLMDGGGQFESSHIPLDHILGEVREPFAIVTAEEKVTADVHGIIDYAVDGLSVVPTGFITNEDDVVAWKRLNHFDSSSHDLLENGKTVRNVLKNRIRVATDNQDSHNDLRFVFLFHYRIACWKSKAKRLVS